MTKSHNPVKAGKPTPFMGGFVTERFITKSRDYQKIH
jgi:hypothetical protein